MAQPEECFRLDILMGVQETGDRDRATGQRITTLAIIVVLVRAHRGLK